MGRELNVAYEFVGEHDPVRVIEPLFDNAFFAPIALGGCTRVAEAKDIEPYFLAGYALEHFVSVYSIPELEMWRTNNVRIATDSGSDEYRYLSDLIKVSDKGIALWDTLSPYERDDPLAGVTYLEPVRMKPQVLAELAKWLHSTPYVTLLLYGSLRVAIRGGVTVPWERAFRYYEQDDEGNRSPRNPLVYLFLFRDALHPNTVHGSIATDATIWLEKGEALNGLVGREEAVENLEGLVSILRSMTCGTNRTPNIEMDMAYRIFYNEEERLKRAFSEFLR